MEFFGGKAPQHAGSSSNQELRDQTDAPYVDEVLTTGLLGKSQKIFLLLIRRDSRVVV